MTKTVSLRKPCGQSDCVTPVNSASTYCERHRHRCPDCDRPIARRADHCLKHRVHVETRPPPDPAVVKARDKEKHRKQVETAKRELPPHQCSYVFDTGVQCIKLTEVQRKKNQGWVRSDFCHRHGAAGTRSTEERRRIASVGGTANAAKLKSDPVYLAERQVIGRQQGLRNLERLGPDGFKSWRESKHSVLSKRKGYGVNWPTIIAGNISKAKAGRTPTAAELDALDHTRAKKTKTFSGEYMRLIRMSKVLEVLPASELLTIEDRAVDEEAKAFVRSVIDRLPGRRRHPLAVIRGREPKWIAKEFKVSVQAARRLVREVREVDALDVTPKT